MKRAEGFRIKVKGHQATIRNGRQAQKIRAKGSLVRLQRLEFKNEGHDGLFQSTGELEADNLRHSTMLPLRQPLCDPPEDGVTRS
jgi:hypothetical protein